MWPEQETTQQLLNGAKEGDPDAIDRLMQRHRNALRRLVRMRLDQKIRRRVDVSDIIQDVLLEANRRLSDYLKKPPMAFHLWLRQIAKDRIIDAHRRHRKSGKRSVDREQPRGLSPRDDASSIQLLAQIGDQQVSPAEAVLRREMARRVEQAIAQLDDQDSEVILMRHYEHLSNHEVAEALQLSQPAASMRYLRAIRRLRELLDITEQGDRDSSARWNNHA